MNAQSLLYSEPGRILVLILCIAIPILSKYM